MPLSRTRVHSGRSSLCPNAVAEWFPLHVGDTWIYQHETRDQGGDRDHLEIETWKTEETIVGSWVVAEGTVFGRHVRITEGAPVRQRVNPHAAYLIRGDCLYATRVFWDPLTHQLAPNTLKSLSIYLSPDFCFPLVVHKTWGAINGLPGLPKWGVTRPEGAKDWEVADVTAANSSVSGSRETFHIRSNSGYLGSGTTGEIWFEKGVGMVREEMIHHGTITEIRTRLIRFKPASSH